MAGDLSHDASKWEAFRLVKEDDVEGLRRALSHHPQGSWSAWRNFAGKTLYQVAEKESRGSGSGRCLEWLRGELQQMDLEPQQVPRVDYVDRVVEQREYVDKVLQVPVQEVHYHKKLKHVPQFREVPVPEVREVERMTVKEELHVVNELVEVPKDVIHTTIREIPDIKHITERREETTEELLPFSLTPVDRVTEVHTVDVHPKVQFVPGEKKIEPSEYEEISVPYELYVPTTEVNYIDKVVVRPKEVPVSNVKEYAVKVPVYEQREVSVVQKDIEVTQHIKHVPEFPMRTEWVPKRHGDLFDSMDANHDGVIDRAEWDAAQRRERSAAVERSASDLKHEMWYELSTLRFRSTHLGKSNAYLRKELELCRARARQLEDSLASERQLREEEERRLEERRRSSAGRVVMHLKPLPVRTDSCAEADRILSPNTSTIFRSAVDMSGISSMFDSPQALTNRADQLFDQLDRNHDGVISREEFYAGMGRRR